jgi:hypothetical protein
MAKWSDDCLVWEAADLLNVAAFDADQLGRHLIAADRDNGMPEATKV